PRVVLREVSCLGRCDLAPASMIAEHPNTFRRAIWRHADTLSWQSDPYAAPAERYGVFREVLEQDRDEAAARVLSALKESGLRGMGGAGSPAAAKWQVVRDETRSPKYVICNADESEPGTFKDRVILSDLPHLIIEGMLLAGLVTGATQGILFLRHEY